MSATNDILHAGPLICNIIAILDFDIFISMFIYLINNCQEVSVGPNFNFPKFSLKYTMYGINYFLISNIFTQSEICLYKLHDSFSILCDTPYKRNKKYMNLYKLSLLIWAYKLLNGISIDVYSH